MPEHASDSIKRSPSSASPALGIVLGARAMRWLRRQTGRDLARGGIAGAEGVATRDAAQVLFRLGGWRVLPASARDWLRSTVERRASEVLAGAALFESRAATSATATTLRAAGLRVVGRLGVAAGAGALIDGSWATAQAVRRVREGALSPRQATAYVVREVCTGAAATAAGAGAAAALVALTGGVAAPALFVVGAAASMGAKAGLDGWVSAQSGALRARLVK
jgi:hypothetical protein